GGKCLRGGAPIESPRGLRDLAGRGLSLPPSPVSHVRDYVRRASLSGVPVLHDDAPGRPLMAGNWPEIIPLPPSGVTGELGSWLRDLANVVNTKLARASYFSGTTPTSAVTALPGYFAINMSPSQSTDSRI